MHLMGSLSAATESQSQVRKKERSAELKYFEHYVGRMNLMSLVAFYLICEMHFSRELQCVVLYCVWIFDIGIMFV